MKKPSQLVYLRATASHLAAVIQISIGIALFFFFEFLGEANHNIIITGLGIWINLELFPRAIILAYKMQKAIKQDLIRSQVKSATDSSKALSEARFIVFTSQAKKMVEIAQAEATKLEQKLVGTEHVLLGLLSLESCPANILLAEQNVSIEKVHQAIESMRASSINDEQEEATSFQPISAKCKKAIEAAVVEATRYKSQTISTEIFLLGILSPDPGETNKAIAILEVLETDLKTLKIQLAAAIYKNKK
jgi:ATP-dependent Clp protease ATP-binding subunit ClpA